MDDLAVVRATGPLWTSTLEDTMDLVGGDLEFHAISTDEEIVDVGCEPRTGLRDEVAEASRQNPEDDLTTALITADVGVQFLGGGDDGVSEEAGRTRRGWGPRDGDPTLEQPRSLRSESDAPPVG